ncbi:MAG: class I SAM-dependent methyltransferase [Blastocatellia bacterium]
MSAFYEEVSKGTRFEFGKNWSRLLDLLDDERLTNAESSLKKMLGVEDLRGKSFLDIGSGSGLFSLAARRLGARVHSFDYDPHSIGCTMELKRRHFAGDQDWQIEEGSALDRDYLSKLGKFDIVYSWGVLHHTGAMWRALDNAHELVAPGGKFFVSIYNDQGVISRYWRMIKACYNRARFLRPLLVAIHWPYLVGLRWTVRALTGRLKEERGMSLWIDMLDWLGGYPFEVAAPSRVIEFYGLKGFSLARSKTCGRRHGCNEFVFEKI